MVAKNTSQQTKPLVGILMGSDSDLSVMGEAALTLTKLGIPSEMQVVSAHRSPELAHEYAVSAGRRGLKAIIVGAGGAAHLAGVVASLTTLPVIGVPIASTPLHGLDALLATVQMPGGIPVATMAIDKAGAVNAAILAAQILATADPRMEQKLIEFKEDLARSITEKNARLQQELAKDAK